MLNCRVRYGNGCGHLVISTRRLKIVISFVLLCQISFLRCSFMCINSAPHHSSSLFYSLLTILLTCLRYFFVPSELINVILLRRCEALSFLVLRPSTFEYLFSLGQTLDLLVSVSLTHYYAYTPDLSTM